MFLCLSCQRIVSSFVFVSSYRGSSQDNSKTILLSPSTLTKELDELLLYLGRLSSLPSAFVITEPVPATSSLRLTSGGHTFHLHLEMTWAAIEAMYLILETPRKSMILKVHRVSVVIGAPSQGRATKDYSENHSVVLLHENLF